MKKSTHDAEQSATKIDDAQRRYFNSPKGKDALKKYYRSDKGQARKRERLSKEKLQRRFLKWLKTHPNGTAKDFLKELISKTKAGGNGTKPG